MMSAVRTPPWATDTCSLPFVIPAQAGIHLLSEGHTQGWWRTRSLGQTKEREMDSRLRGNDEVRVREDEVGVRDGVPLSTTSGAPH